MSHSYYDEINKHYEPTDIEDVSEFYKLIERKSLTKQLSAERPYVYWTMEVYDQENGIKGGGGLGVLAADTRRVAEQLDVPFVMVTPFFGEETHQAVNGFRQEEYHTQVSPQDFGYTYLDNVQIKFKDASDASLYIYEKQLGSTRFITMTEPNFGELYAGGGSSDHRLYQQTALGFGGYQALKKVGIKPAIIQLNETATIFAALARLDELCSNGMNLYEAIVYVRKHTLYTNHTLIQAAESAFSYDQFERFVFPNIKSKTLRGWLIRQFDNGIVKPSSLAVELAEAKNGVSRLHAKVADFRDRDGDKVKFHAVTNGIDMKTWVSASIMKFYEDEGILDKFGLTSEDYKEKIDSVDPARIRELKKEGRRELLHVLSKRKNQYGEPVVIPEDAFIFDFKRRFISYKRPGMVFEDLDRLRSILEKNNAHYILTGKTHQVDFAMKDHLEDILHRVDQDEVLRERVHYLQDYDEELGRALSVGADAAINVPIVGLEACGTSWEKDIANLKILISTADGGVADVMPVVCLEVTGKTHDDERESLYRQMEKAIYINSSDEYLSHTVKRQLKAYLPTISGVRMMKDYLRFLFDN